MNTLSSAALATISAFVLFAGSARSAEFYMGEPVEKEGMQFSPAYLTGIEMDRHPAGMSMDPKAVHIEIDIHATKDEKRGFPDEAWIPYLKVGLTVEKVSGGYKESKILAPMNAKDGPHYANNFAMAGPGEYKATYQVEPPSANGFIRHVDAETGVPEWWKPITVSWTFQYPSKPKPD
jgi:periplasmic iron binding protein